MFVFEQLILIVRSFIDEYDSKIGISDKKKEDVQLARALDHIRQKYGFTAIKPAV